MKKFLIPAVLIIMSTGGALASKTVSSSAKAVTQGYRIGNMNEDPCVPVEKSCETINTGTLCTYFDGTSTHNLQNISGSVCVGELYEIQP
ncbi:DUF6520 family protein [Chryseobacterium sp. JUb7]|uniref:DUF6520 family protein n=1 Tax=Chryseobacterium sp. JUb7 TaxID=2940599 RepID=UPI002167B3E9|nr:DUF6520 family protein [Chryseobacterium sp. JUb7]MCS3533070.1 hypothetical protein [Chryseobacterium sp. JUb7]